jgi:integrase
MGFSPFRGDGMANTKVSLVRRCKTPEGWRQYPVVMSPNGKIKPGFVWVGKVEQHYPDGYYALRSYVGSKIVYERLSDRAADALDAKKRALSLIDAKKHATAAGAQIVEQPGRKNLRVELKKFIEATKDRGSSEAAEVYTLALAEFFQVVGKTYADEITPEDITKFHKALQKRGLSDRTVSNRHNSVRAFLIYLKLDYKGMPKPPRFTKTIPEIYTADEMTAFFGAITEDDFKLKVMFAVYLQTGIREREEMHLEWSNIKHGTKVLQLRSKPKYRFKMKDHEERDLPLSDDLLEMLDKYRVDYPAQSPLIFGKDERGGKPGDKPDGHMLRTLKNLVLRLGLNCKACEGCLGTSGECEEWYLHKFRATYCTQMWRQTHDIIAVMKMMGHANVETTMSYIRPAEGEIVQSAVNQIKWY